MNIAALIPIAEQIARALLSAPLINRAIDNYTAGTVNTWDDAVWRVIENVMHLDAADLPAAAVPQLEAIQAQYDAAKLAGEVPSAPVG